MRWYEISGIKRTEIIERNKCGDSFSKIAKDLKREGLKLDRRQVSRIVQEGGTLESGRLVIRHDELVQLFRTHLTDMKTAAEILLDITAGPGVQNSILPPSGKISEVLDALMRHFKEARMVSYLLSKGKDPSVYSGLKDIAKLSDAVELRLARCRARAAFEGLKAHIEEYQLSFQKWNEALNVYRKGWDELKKEASTAGVKSGSFEQTVKAALENLPKDDEEECLPRNQGRTDKDTPEQDYHKILYRPEAKLVLIALQQRKDNIMKAYDHLEDLLCSPRIDNALVNGHCEYCPIP
ncbi:hypothetical protein ACFLTP_03695 [Chloroflexota bacterium]